MSCPRSEAAYLFLIRFRLNHVRKYFHQKGLMSQANSITIPPRPPLGLPGPPLPQSWFVIATSASLKKGRHREVKFLDRPWVLFRGADSEVGLIARYCSHMGADLKQGCVRGNQMTCPLHGWGFSKDGQCQAAIPAPLAEQAALHTLAIREWAGMIFVFPAKTPTYELPSGLLTGKDQFSSARKMSLPLNWMMPAMNTFDLAHFPRVHNRVLVGVPKISSLNANHLSMEMESRILPRRWQDKIMKFLTRGTLRVTMDCWGASLLIMRNEKTGIGAVIAVESTGPASCHLYITAFQVADAQNPKPKKRHRLTLEIGRRMATAFLRPDIPLLTGMIPRPGVLIPGQDDVAMRFWAFYHALPKIAVANEV